MINHLQITSHRLLRDSAEYLLVPVKLLMLSSVYLANKMQRIGLKVPVTIPNRFTQYAIIPLQWWITGVKKLQNLFLKID